MNRFYLSCLFIISLVASVSAQDPILIDSLNRELVQSKNDTLNVQIYKKLVWQYYYTQPDTADMYVEKMITLSKKSKYTRGLIDANNIVAVLYYAYSEYDSALIFFRKAYELSNSEKYATERIYSLNYAGHSYMKKANFYKADSCFERIIDLARKKQDITGLAKGYKALGISHSDRGLFLEALKFYFKTDSLLADQISIDRAENLQNIGIAYHSLENAKAERRYYEAALEVYTKMDDEYGQNALRLSLGILENDDQNYEKAKDYLLIARSYFEKINDPTILGNIEFELGNSNLSLSNYDEAKKLYLLAVNSVKDSEGSLTLTNAYFGLGNVYLELEKYNEAALYYEKALESAMKIGRLGSISKILDAQAKLFYKSGDYKKAYELKNYQQIFLDSLNDQKSSKVLHELEAKYQNDEKQQEIELLTAQNKIVNVQQKNQQTILLSIIVVVLAIVIFLFILYRNRQKTAKKLKEIDTLKSTFFANISHEFRTPLTLIKAPIEEQLMNDRLDESQIVSLQIVDRNANRLLELVDQLLDLSKLDTGSMTLRVNNGSITSLIGAILPSFEYAYKHKKIAYEATTALIDIKNWFDPDILEKVVVNLLSNALKYTPTQGSVKFFASIKSEMLTITVKNTGEGINPQEVERVFDRFYQANNGNEGVGIGLALVKQLVKLHKGTISFSTEEDKWNAFTIVLPVNRSAFKQIEIDTSINEKANIKLLNVERTIDVSETAHVESDGKPIMLAIDDNKDILSVLSILFSKQYTILKALNGEEGYNIAMEHVPDIIISDVMMPKMNGIELSQKLKGDERTSHIPIILLTAKAGEQNEIEGLETGVDDYVMKPFSNEVLKVRVAKLIELRSELRQRYSQELVIKPKDIAITSVDEKFLERVQQVLDQKLTDSDFNVEIFCREVGMSRMQLHRKLKALINLSTSEFIRSQRLKLAATLLATSDQNISEVGYAVGFNDPSYFAKCFKEVYGTSPKDFSKSDFTFSK